MARDVQVPDPLGWLNKIASKVYGYDLKLQVLEMLDEPQSLICASGDRNVKIAFSPISPADLRRIKNTRLNRLSKFAEHHPLLLLSRNVSVRELSVLNGGHLFDLELSLVWKALTGHDVETTTKSLSIWTVNKLPSWQGSLCFAEAIMSNVTVSQPAVITPAIIGLALIFAVILFNRSCSS